MCLQSITIVWDYWEACGKRASMILGPQRATCGRLNVSMFCGFLRLNVSMSFAFPRLNVSMWVFAFQSNGETPLYVASQKGHADVVSVLVKAGAAINQARVSALFAG
jgi:hypothetical protein